MSEDAKLTLFLIIFISFWVIFLHVWRHIRSARLKRLAQRYSLDFSKNFKLFYPGDKEFNLISGILNRHDVKIYDTVSYKNYAGVGTGIDSYRSVYLIDDNLRQTINSFTRISSIKKELKRLS